MKSKKIILGCALGNCVHIGGLNHFLRLAELEGFNTISLGPAVPTERLIREIENYLPDIVAVSYRLTPEVAEKILDILKRNIEEKSFQKIRFIFGGTPSVAVVARKSKIFEKVFDGTENTDEVKSYLRGSHANDSKELFPQTLIDRIQNKYPYPIIRHHFGRPTIKETVEGIKKIAEAQVLDVISIGTDQNAQEYFFRPELIKHELDGAGGVPVRHPEDLIEIYNASRCGNYPLMRCYSGTNDLIKWAEMSIQTINNAWGAIPLTWYSVMDGRSNRPLDVTIAENQLTMQWYANHEIPVEVNESHQWSLRDAHDSLAVATSFLAAYNAKKMGVKNYISQYMFNTPPGTTPQMDIAKMLAKNELIGKLTDDKFRVYKEVRAGIAHFSPNPNIAKGQLAASALISLSLQPHILHVVAFCEGDHAVYPDELIESCDIVHGVIQNTLYGLPDYSIDKIIIERKNILIEEAEYLLNGLKKFGNSLNDDPWCDPKTLASAIKVGILDTPHFSGNPNLSGNIKTNLINGAWFAIDRESGKIITEKERLQQFDL
jgi:hypothetical protein